MGSLYSARVGGSAPAERRGERRVDASRVHCWSDTLRDARAVTPGSVVPVNLNGVIATSGLYRRDVGKSEGKWEPSAASGEGAVRLSASTLYFNYARRRVGWSGVDSV